MQICFLLKTLQKFLKIKKSAKVKKMKAMRIIISIAFVFISIATLTVFISEKINTDKTIPQIKVEEEVIEVSLKATDEELLKGVTAHDEKDGDLTEKIIVESISRFTEKGVSKVTYTVCDSDNNVAKATRKIKFKGYKSPRFKVSGNLCFSLYERIDIKGLITASDSIDGNISNKIIITSEKYSNTNAGAYTLDVTVTNSKGDTSIIQLPLIVEDRPASVPKIELKEYLIYIKKGETIDFKTYLVDALDSKKNSLKNKVTIEPDIDFNKEGTYQVHYYATDSLGQRGHSVMTVIVGE